MSRHIKLLVVHQGAELYGSDQMLCHLLKILKDTDHYAINVHLPHTGPLVERIKNYYSHLVIKPISILRLSTLKTKKWLNLKQFIRNLYTAHTQIQNHDIIILNTTIILSYLIIFPFYNKRKYIYVHELPTGFIKWVLNGLLFYAGAELIFNSHATANAYPFIANCKKHVLYNVAPYDGIYVPPDKQMNRLNLLLIGRISPRKGHHILIEALKSLPHVTLRIVGSMYDKKNPYLQILKNNITEFNLQSQISFIPFSCNTLSHYQWADVVIIPSIKPESFGLVALEAMQHGRAVIASDIGGLPEIISHAETGYLIKHDCVQSAVKAIQYYTDNPDDIIKHGRNGMTKAKETFDINLYKKRLNEILLEGAAP